MVSVVTSLDEYADFIAGFVNDPVYYDPHFTYDRNNLFGALSAKDQYVFSVTKDGSTAGLFVWLVLPEDRYLEQIIGFTRNGEAFSEMLAFLAERYPGYAADLVIAPQNPALVPTLRERGAAFDPEQRRMICSGVFSGPVTCPAVELYTDRWEEQYRCLHRTDTYWTAERVLAARERFRVFLTVEGDRLLGYLDVTYGQDENEPYDLFVIPAARHRGYETALIGKAVGLNCPNRMMVLVDTDAEEEIGFYAGAGFVTAEGQNSVYASLRL